MSRSFKTLSVCRVSSLECFNTLLFIASVSNVDFVILVEEVANMEFNPEHVDVGNMGRRSIEVFRFCECMKNQAAKDNVTAVDGCLEFMPSGDAGTMEALICAACSCHRNFHRRERVENLAAFQPPVRRQYCCHHGHTGCPYMTPPQHHHPRPQPSARRDNVSDPSSSGGKRFRTKFTQDQKDRMLAFAQGLGWHIKKENEADVQQFCADMGISKKVFKVWMHNNKHTLGKVI
ncbi:putative transcription factor ZF-HD family [Helianthus annuus]|uniref:Putative ZF-HD homeobox protein, Cys/His-rich dimerization domain-containing protein n=2 Tax=Helianthus annuus TaxID=4232 RepID=A0A251TWS7_HELAN|nr:putative transcription factor ZF-HD family [Helianthus annuus]KAJ0533396.1 putative transcription factor ZF-HD family [Helianthus annuus]KAJ0541699.1 putative transcription factor ZF-HD family [Helianthus annuus]KAJ0706773.1 putative transcription factor ZF-HD family [Helianthus annuus]KAJ0710808.1 putative transcription factor ZF-HD family [Helianthus annuus]